MNVVTSLAVLENGNLVSGSLNSSIQIWDVKRGEIVKSLDDNMNNVRSLVTLQDGNLASGTFVYDVISMVKISIIKILNPETGKTIKVLIGHKGQVISI